MSIAPVGPAEPQVLAHAKRRLFPDDGPDAYAVVDTQFSTEEWRADDAVAERTRETLAPFNHVAVGSGFPDLVGVGVLDDDLVAVERQGDDPPLVVVEAKGYTARGTVDVERGVVQAHDRLGEANVAFVAAPGRAIDESARTLARDLNVGVLAVESDGGVTPLERPRVVGSRTTDAASAIRFQASAQGVTDRSFGLNHPKNYVGVPLAVAHAEPTDAVLERFVVGATASARTGAAFLGLIDERPDGSRLTGLGREVVRFARERYDSLDDALATVADWQGSRRRFVDIAPVWGQVVRRVVYDYPATELLVTELQTMHDDGTREPSLVDLVEYLHLQHPSFAVELFVRGTDAARSAVLTADGDLRRAALRDGSVYHSPTVFQLKAMLYHAGLLTERGAEPSSLDPESDVWALRHSVPDR